MKNLRSGRRLIRSRPVCRSITRRPQIEFLYNGLSNTAWISAGTLVGVAAPAAALLEPAAMNPTAAKKQMTATRAAALRSFTGDRSDPGFWMHGCSACDWQLWAALRLSGGGLQVRLVHQFCAHLGFDFVGHRGVVLEQLARVLASLTDALAVVGVPGAELLHDVLVGGEIDQLAFLGDARAVENVELRLFRSEE